MKIEKIDNNTIAIVGVIGVAIVAIVSAIVVAETEIGTGLVALAGTGLGGVIGYLAKGMGIRQPDLNIEEFKEIVENAIKSDEEIGPVADTEITWE